jgi:hypothetical protein
MWCRLMIAMAVAVSLPAFAQEPGDDLVAHRVSNDWTLSKSDRIFLISTQADTIEPMTFRIGTVDQLQTVQAGAGNGWGSGQGFSGYYSDVFADFAPLPWLQLGLTMNYATVGDPATLNIPAPTAYVKAQFLREDRAGVNMAFAVNLKKIGFSRPTDDHPNDGEIEGQLDVDKRIGKVLLVVNGVFGKSFSVPDSDAELKLSAGYYVLHNLVIGFDSISRYDTSFDGGPQDGTRYWELTGGAMATWKVWKIGLSLLAGVASPMHTPLGTSGVGPTGMVQVSITE